MANKENKVLWLSQEDCIACGAQDMKFVLRNVERANAMLGLGETREIGLVHMMWEEGKHSGKRVGLHGCIINSQDGDIHVASIKSIPSNPANPPRLQKPRSNGLLILYDEDTGYPLAVMDDTLVSSMRTGAGSALGAKCCANPDSEVMGFLGSGVIASRWPETIKIMSAARPEPLRLRGHVNRFFSFLRYAGTYQRFLCSWEHINLNYFIFKPLSIAS